MIRFATFPAEEIFILMEMPREASAYFGDLPQPKLKSSRLELFKTKGVICVACDLEGTYFALEAVGEERPHLNLYAAGENGQEILFTKDHIKPKSLGGANALPNYQTMCEPCNGRKANKDIAVPPRLAPKA